FSFIAILPLPHLSLFFLQCPEVPTNLHLHIRRQPQMCIRTSPNKHNTTTGVSKTQHHTPKPRRELGCTQSELHKEKPNGQKTPPIHWSVVSPGG
ncbi:hypothetical protein, partial [Bifidobacterium animalis]|uniref:hypothetical protein n=1 Tax=Bifidobacterium animalis TaxID=28025 RepID=UPI001A7E0507